MIAYAQQVITDGIPPQDNRAFFEKRGFIYLDDMWGQLMIRIWLNSVVSTGFSLGVDAQTVFVYASEYGLNKVETLEIIKNIEGSVKREK